MRGGRAVDAVVVGLVVEAKAPGDVDGRVPRAVAHSRARPVAQRVIHALARRQRGHEPAPLLQRERLAVVVDGGVPRVRERRVLQSHRLTFGVDGQTVYGFAGVKRRVHDGVGVVVLLVPVPVLVPGVGPARAVGPSWANPRPSIRSIVSLRGSCTRRLATSQRRSFASAGDAEAVGLVRDARRERHGPRARRPRRQRAEPAVARAGSLAAALPPRPNLGGTESRRTLRGVPPLAEPLRRLLVGMPHPELRDAELRDARYAIALRHGGAGPVRDPHGGHHRGVGIPGIARIAGGQRPLRVPFSRWGSGVVSAPRRRGAGRPRSTLPAVRLRGIGPPGSREHDPPTSTAELSWVVTAPPPIFSERTNPLGEASSLGTSTEK